MNIFLINTPHQLINAFEARHHFGLPECLLVVDISETYRPSQYETLLQDMSWEKVKFINPAFHTNSGGRNNIGAKFKRFYNDYDKTKQLDAIAGATDTVQSVFLGNYNNKFMRHFANNIGTDNVCLLDDGTRTVSVGKIRRNLHTKGQDSFSRIAGRRFKDRIFGLDMTHPRQVTYFTTYDIEPCNGDRLEINEYSYLKSMASLKTTSDEVYFLGQPLVEGGLLQMEVFVEYIGKVVQFFSGENFVYLPHKHERHDKVNYLKNTLGIATRSFDVPIEYQMSVRGNRPKILASFFSSAMENSRIIFGEMMHMKIFEIDNRDVVDFEKEFVADIYAYYRSKQNANLEVLAVR